MAGPDRIDLTDYESEYPKSLFNRGKGKEWSLGIEASKISENTVRTPDYGNVDIAFEATTIHPYFPKMAEIDKIIVNLQNNLGNCYHAYNYSDSNNNPVLKIVSKEKWKLLLRTYTCYIVIIQYKTVKVDGVNIFYRQAENTKKPTILLLHGFPSSSHMFRNLIKELADEYNIIAPDYPGFGNSDQPP